MTGTKYDQLYGMGGADIMFGEDGNDYIWGDGTTDATKLSYAAPQDHGDDVLDGGSGNDQLVGAEHSIPSQDSLQFRRKKSWLL